MPAGRHFQSNRTSERCDSSFGKDEPSDLVIKTAGKPKYRLKEMCHSQGRTVSVCLHDKHKQQSNKPLLPREIPPRQDLVRNQTPQIQGSTQPTGSHLGPHTAPPPIQLKLPLLLQINAPPSQHHPHIRRRQHKRHIKEIRSVRHPVILVIVTAATVLRNQTKTRA